MRFSGLAGGLDAWRIFVGSCSEGRNTGVLRFAQDDVSFWVGWGFAQDDVSFWVRGGGALAEFAAEEGGDRAEDAQLGRAGEPVAFAGKKELLVGDAEGGEPGL